MMLSTVFLAVLAVAPTTLPTVESPGTPPPEPALARIALLGASVTDGFLLPNEVGAMVTLADVVQGAVAAKISLPFRRSSAMFFTDPVRFGRIYAEQAKEYDPTVIIAIDYLFWFAYGWQSSEEARMKRLNQGLAFLEDFDCEIVVADLPDFNDASTRGVGIHGRPMISPFQVPKPKTLEKLNARIRDWAASRKNAHVAPLVHFRNRIDQRLGIEFRGNTWGEDAHDILMDDDLLHTRFEGTIALGLLALDVLARECESIPESAFIWDAQVVRRRVLDARAVERQQRGASTENEAPASKG